MEPDDLMIDMNDPNVLPEELADDPFARERIEAWNAYRADPMVQAAQRRADDREEQLRPLKDFYNNELTKTKLAFQVEAAVAVTRLTLTLQEIDARQQNA